MPPPMPIGVRSPRASELECGHSPRSRIRHVLALQHPPENPVEELLVGDILDVEIEARGLARLPRTERIPLAEIDRRSTDGKRMHIWRGAKHLHDRPSEVIELRERAKAEDALDRGDYVSGVCEAVVHAGAVPCRDNEKRRTV